MQLELLELWHAALTAQLTTFAQQFRGAGGRLLLAADKSGFSVAAEGCNYEGPLRLEVGLDACYTALLLLLPLPTMRGWRATVML